MLSIYPLSHRLKEYDIFTESYEKTTLHKTAPTQSDLNPVNKKEIMKSFN